MPLLKSVRHALTAALIVSFAPVVALQHAAAGVLPSCAAAGIGVDPLGGPNFYVDNNGAFYDSYTGFRLTNSTETDLSDVRVSLSNFTHQSGGTVTLGLAPSQPAAEQIPTLNLGTSAPLYWYLAASGKDGSTSPPGDRAHQQRGVARRERPGGARCGRGGQPARGDLRVLRSVPVPPSGSRPGIPQPGRGPAAVRRSNVGCGSHNAGCRLVPLQCSVFGASIVEL